MDDFFEEYGSVILACTIALIIIAATTYFLKSGYLGDWVLDYAKSLGG